MQRINAMRIGLASTLDWIATFECSFMLKKFAGSIFNESITWYPMHAEEIKAKPERERKKTAINISESMAVNGAVYGETRHHLKHVIILSILLAIYAY